MGVQRGNSNFYSVKRQRISALYAANRTFYPLGAMVPFEALTDVFFLAQEAAV